MKMSEAKLFKKINNSYIEITKDQLLIEIQEANKSLEKEIERLNENNQHMQEEMARTWEKYDNLQVRIDKAIEKIESVRIYGLRSGKTLIATLLNDVLDILKGSDKE